jgi:hypothetical protein
MEDKDNILKSRKITNNMWNEMVKIVQMIQKLKYTKIPQWNMGIIRLGGILICFLLLYWNTEAETL